MTVVALRANKLSATEASASGGKSPGETGVIGTAVQIVFLLLIPSRPRLRKRLRLRLRPFAVERQFQSHPVETAGLSGVWKRVNCIRVNTPQETHEASQRRLELARQAMQELSGQSHWYADEHWAVTEEQIPEVIKKLRLCGGHRGYRIVAELCRQEILSAKCCVCWRRTVDN